MLTHQWRRESSHHSFSARRRSYIVRGTFSEFVTHLHTAVGNRRCLGNINRNSWTNVELDLALATPPHQQSATTTYQTRKLNHWLQKIVNFFFLLDMFWRFFNYHGPIDKIEIHKRRRLRYITLIVWFYVVQSEVRKVINGLEEPRPKCAIFTNVFGMAGSRTPPFFIILCLSSLT